MVVFSVLAETRKQSCFLFKVDDKFNDLRLRGRVCAHHIVLHTLERLALYLN